MNTYGKALFSEFMKVVLLPFHLKKIKENRIVFTGLTGEPRMNIQEIQCTSVNI